MTDQLIDGLPTTNHKREHPSTLCMQVTSYETRKRSLPFRQDYKLVHVAKCMSFSEWEIVYYTLAYSTPAFRTSYFFMLLTFCRAHIVKCKMQ